jgi:hypothetical protein
MENKKTVTSWEWLDNRTVRIFTVEGETYDLIDPYLTTFDVGETNQSCEDSAILLELSQLYDKVTYGKF